MRTLALAALALGLVAFAPLDAAAQEQFIPFTPVEDVCPTCQPNRFDRIELTDGREVRAWILLENPIFYLAERHGELRAIPRTLVRQITRGTDGRPLVQGHVDQILLKNGHVLSGSISTRYASGYYELVSADKRFTHTAHQDYIARIFRSGREVKVGE